MQKCIVERNQDGDVISVKIPNKDFNIINSEVVQLQAPSGRILPKYIPVEMLDTMLEKLNKTGLSNSIYKMDSEMIDEKLNELGVKNVVITPKGFVHNGDVYLNVDSLSIDTPIHEFSHLYINWLKNNKKEIYDRGVNLIKNEVSNKDSEIKSTIDYVKNTQPNLTDDSFYEEILSQLIGENGAKLIETNRDSNMTRWILKTWDEIKKILGLSKYSTEKVMNMTLSEYTTSIATDLLEGNKIIQNVSLSVLENDSMTKMEGKNVSPESIRQELNKPGVKQIEKDIINSILGRPEFKTKKINYNVFKNAVRAEIMPLTKISSGTYADYGVIDDYDNVETIIYNSPLDHGIVGHFDSYYNEGGKFKYLKQSASRDSDYDFKLDFGFAFELSKIDDNNPLSDLNVIDNTNSQVIGKLPHDYTLDDMRSFVKNIQSNIENKGLFGHTRVWTKDNVYSVSEVQSDMLQKKDNLNEFKTLKGKEKRDYQDEKLIELREKLVQNINNIIEPVSITVEEYNDSVDIETLIKDNKKKHYEQWLTDIDRNILKLKEQQDEVRSNKAYDDLENEIQSQRDLKYSLINDIDGNVNNLITEYSRELNRLYNSDIPKTNFNNFEKQLLASVKFFEMRLIRESLKDAAEKGYVKFRLPTAYTTASIEGHINNSQLDLEKEPEEGDEVEFMGEPHFIMHVDQADNTVVVVPAREVTREHENHHIDSYTDDIIGNLNSNLEEYGKAKNIEEFMSALGEDIRGYSQIEDYLTASYGNEEEINIDDVSSDIATIIVDNSADSDILNYWNELFNGSGYVVKKGSSYYMTHSTGETVTYASRSAIKEEFDMNELPEELKAISKRSVEMGKFLEKERGKNNFRIVTDAKGYDWYETDILASDKINPVLAFQIPINELTEEQEAYIRTPEFIEFFGDWINDPENASKVVDENGKPKLVWSGHSERINSHSAYTNRTEDNRIDNDAFFPEDIRVAESYSTGGAIDFTTISESMLPRFEKFKGSVEPVFLNIRNPKIVENNNGVAITSLIGQSIEEGHDGFYGNGNHSSTKVWSILDNSQVMYANDVIKPEIEVKLKDEIPSQLYQELKEQPFLNSDQALEIYKNVHTEGLDSWKSSEFDC